MPVIYFSSEDRASIRNMWQEIGHKVTSSQFDRHMASILGVEPYAIMKQRIRMHLTPYKAWDRGEIVDMSVCEEPQSIEEAMRKREIVRKTRNEAWV